MATSRRRIASRLGLSVVSALAGLGWAGCGESSSPARDTAAAQSPRASGGQTLVFVGDIRSGPSGGLSVFGRLELQLGRSGQVSGAVVHHDERVPVSGRVEGRSVTLVLDLPGGGRISGVGTAAHQIRSVADIPTTGSLKGPLADDTGDWELSSPTQDALKRVLFGAG